MGKFLDKIQNLFLDTTAHEVITFEFMQDYELYKWERFVNGIEVMKVYDDDTILLFLTKIPKGKKFGVHMHDCVERCYVIEGWLNDLMTKENKIGGQVITYPSNIPHEPQAKEETLLTVSFKRNANN